MANLNAEQYQSFTDYDPQRQANGTIFIAVPEGLKYEFEPISPSFVLQQSVKSFNLPKPSSMEIPVYWQNQITYFPGHMQVEPFQVVFTQADFRSELATTTEFLRAWDKLIRDFESGKVGWASSYKTSVMLIQNSADGKNVRNVFQLKGVWPQMIDFGEVDYTIDEVNPITVTFRCDRLVHIDKNDTGQYTPF